jgi:hypothetical protein
MPAVKRRADEIGLDEILTRPKLQQLIRQVARHPKDALDEEAEEVRAAPPRPPVLLSQQAAGEPPRDAMHGCDGCAQAVIDIAEDFVVRMCGAAKLLAEHRSSAEAAAAAPGSALLPRATVEVKDFKLYLSRHAGIEVTDFDEQRWVETLQTKLADEKRAREEAAARRWQRAPPRRRR